MTCDCRIIPICAYHGCQKERDMTNYSNPHAECLYELCPTPDQCFEMCKLHRKAHRQSQEQTVEPGIIGQLRDAGSVVTREEAASEIEKLRTENWQLKQALGYPIPADKETPQNPFKCGVCEARRIESR